MSESISILDASDSDFESRLTSLLERDQSESQEIDQVVNDIIQAVRSRGDEALVEFTNRLDRRDVGAAGELEVPVETLRRYADEIDAAQRVALEYAARRIESFHARQRESSWDYHEEDGSRYGQIVTPLDKVGVYVPGGKAAYPSSVLMNVMPAKVAGVREIVMVVPAPDGELNPTVMAAAAIAGVDRVFTVGGAQAVAALAWGTDLVPRVDKIVGPGNIYVAMAKRQVFGQVGIDMIAGPSEVAIICDEGADPDWVAMDLFAQAEHDEMAQSILITPSQTMVDKVRASVDKLLPTMERADIISAALKGQGAIIKVADMEEAARVSNRIAPEHLELQLADPDVLLPAIRHAGAIFAGYHSAESLGDYCAGPNHVLPTSGTARFSSPLGVYDFQKRSSLIQCSARGAGELAGIASVLARSEQLTAHARSAEYRGE